MQLSSHMHGKEKLVLSHSMKGLLVAQEKLSCFRLTQVRRTLQYWPMTLVCISAMVHYQWRLCGFLKDYADATCACLQGSGRAALAREQSSSHAANSNPPPAKKPPRAKPKASPRIMLRYDMTVKQLATKLGEFCECVNMQAFSCPEYRLLQNLPGGSGKSCFAPHGDQISRAIILHSTGSCSEKASRISDSTPCYDGL